MSKMHSKHLETCFKIFLCNIQTEFGDFFGNLGAEQQSVNTTLTNHHLVDLIWIMCEPTLIYVYIFRQRATPAFI